LDRVERQPIGDLLGLIAPHAGLMYSGPVAAHAYRAVEGRDYDVAVLVGPSHFVGFDGVSIYEHGAFDTPLGPAPIAANWADAIRRASSVVYPYPPAHVREHSLEMQLPFLLRVLPAVPIVPLVMGYQTRETILELARALAAALKGVRALLVASTDLSHYFDARVAAALDGKVIDCVSRLDPEGLLSEFEKYPEGDRGRYVACGGGPAISVMRAVRELGATDAVALRYADSGDVSGDKQAVVGYLAAAMGRGLRFKETGVRSQN
jgi:AmmeMemoRadiSam system protein B